MDALAACRDWLAQRGATETLAKHRLDAATDRSAGARALAMVAAVQEIGGLLTETEHVFIKGPVLSQLLYGDPARRACHDVDVLVKDVPEAIDRLQAAGYRPVYPIDAQDPRVRRGTNAYPLHKHVMVEVHWTLFPPGLLRHGVHLEGSPLQFAGTNVSAARGPEALYHLVLHGATSAYRRLLWLSDVMQWLHRFPEDADAVARRARDEHNERALTITAACMEIILPDSTPESWPMPDKRTNRWAKRIRDGWLDPQELPWRNTTDLAYQVRLRPGYRLRYACRRVLMPGFEDAVRHPTGNAQRDWLPRLARKAARIGRRQRGGPRP